MRESPGLRLEQELWAGGIQFIGGVDEAGRGALAGPVMAGVVILPNDFNINLTLAGVRNSKQMTPRQRGLWAEVIKQAALAWAVGSASAEEIDSAGILPSTRLAVGRAIQALALKPEYLLMDYIHWPGLDHPHQMMPKGESFLSASRRPRCWRKRSVTRRWWRSRVSIPATGWRVTKVMGLRRTAPPSKKTVFPPFTAVRL